jgi:hypothetical protein
MPTVRHFLIVAATTVDIRASEVVIGDTWATVAAIADMTRRVAARESVPEHSAESITAECREAFPHAAKAASAADSMAADSAEAVSTAVVVADVARNSDREERAYDAREKPWEQVPSPCSREAAE